MNITIPGIGPVPVSSAEYTSGKVVQTYSTNMAILASLFDKRQDVIDYITQYNQQHPNNPLPIPTLLQPHDLDNLVAAIQQLTNLLHNGAVDGTPPNTYVSFLPQDAALKLGLVLQSLKAVGITGTLNVSGLTDEVKINIMQNWQSLAGIGVEHIIKNALSFADASPTRTLQSMIELEYVKQGNELIFNQLGDLEEALQTTQGILDNLARLQSVSNQIKAPSPSGFSYLNQPDGGSVPVTGAGYPADYQSAANAHFRQQRPIPVPTSTAAAELLQAKSALKIQLANLISQNPQAASAATSLAFFLNKVIKDISATFAVPGRTPLSAVKIWIMDNQDALLGTPLASSTGNIQTNLSQAITAAESLNDTQKQKVQRFMFIFEEFYKSSSALLQKITQLVEQMAQGISR